MKFALSTVACPEWDFDTLAGKAKALGYDGVEVRGFLNESVLTASNIFLTDPAKIKALFKYHGVEIACIASSIAFTGKNKKRDAQLADDCRRYIDLAGAVGCGIVKIFDTQVWPGQTRAGAGVVFGDWLEPLGDYAADRGVLLVVENALSYRSSKELWLILDRLQHPAIACAWDVFNAALIGESPFVSVPTLNSRIAYAQVRDAKLGPLGATFCKMGEGDVQVQKFLSRLKGIGYEGYVTFEWEKAWLPGITGPDESLPDAIAKLKEWTSDPKDEKTEKKKDESKEGKAPVAAGH